MKRVLLKVMSALMLALLFMSCQSFERVSYSEIVEPEHLNPVRGKVLGVYPTEIDFAAIRLALDLRDVEIEVNGQNMTLQKRYIAEIEDEDYGTLGLLDSNIFRRSGLDKENLSTYTRDLLVKGLENDMDYYVGYITGLGEGKMGYLSNKAIQWNYDVYPPEAIMDGEKAAPVFSKIVLLEEDQDPAEAGVDVVMYSSVTLRSEVSEILEAPVYANVFDESNVKNGEYYLFLQAGVWCLFEDLSGNEIFDTNTKMEYPIYTMDKIHVKIPAGNGNADEYAKYFREVDFTDIAEETLDELIPNVFPIFSNYYVNYDIRVPVED